MSTPKSRSWILTHASSGSFLTFDLFQSNQLCIDECHYTWDAAVVYTYVHFKAPITTKVMMKFLEQMHQEHNIILFDIFGYDSVVSFQADNQIQDHVGFKILLDRYQKKNSQFVSCTDGQPGISRGVFWRADSFSRIKDIVMLRNKSLGPFLDEMDKIWNESKQKDETINLLREQVAHCEAQIEETTKQMQHYEYICYVLKFRINRIDPAIRDILLAPDHKGMPME